MVRQKNTLNIYLIMNTINNNLVDFQCTQYMNYKKQDIFRWGGDVSIVKAGNGHTFLSLAASRRGERIYQTRIQSSQREERIYNIFLTTFVGKISIYVYLNIYILFNVFFTYISRVNSNSNSIFFIIIKYLSCIRYLPIIDSVGNR